MKRLFFILLICGLSVKANSQTLSKNEKIQKMLELSGSGKMGIQVMKTMIASFQNSYSNVSQQFWDDFIQEVKADDIVNLIIPIYDKYYSENDIDLLILFYNSPIGKKTIEMMPVITKESMAAGQIWGAEIGKKVRQQLTEKGYIKE